MALPTFKSDELPFMLMQTKWKGELDPVLANPATNPRIIKNVSLASGSTVINHGLGAPLQGWKIVDINGAATVYRSAPPSPLTLTLTSSAAVTVTLEVY